MTTLSVRDEYAPRFGLQVLTLWSGAFASDYEGEAVETVTFVGSVYGGPVVMITPEGNQFFVTDSDRFGEFGPEWVRKFFA